jgi:hypothetical protein
MRKVPCFNPDCWSRRIHHERPDEPRGQRFVEVPDNWDGSHAFCSMMCAVESGFMSLVPAAYGPCKKCFVAVKGEDVIYHHGTWKCVRPEVTEDEFQQLWIGREERMQAFRDKLERGEVR